MRTTNESIKFYLEMVNNGSNTIYLQQENGSNNIKTTNGNELIFSGTKKEVYYFLLGVCRIMRLYDQYNQKQPDYWSDKYTNKKTPRTGTVTEIDLEDLVDD